MDHPMSLPASDGERIVYIRAVPVSDLPQEAQAQVSGDAIYAIHDAAGNRLALVSDRDLAFAVARQHEMTPFSVH